jgi:hypothetical protein
MIHSRLLYRSAVVPAEEEGEVAPVSMGTLQQCYPLWSTSDIGRGNDYRGKKRARWLNYELAWQD